MEHFQSQFLMTIKAIGYPMTERPHNKQNKIVLISKQAEPTKILNTLEDES